MAYDECLAEDIRELLKNRRGIKEKRMFGGLCFLLNGRMCCGVEGTRFVARIGPQRYESALKVKHVSKMDFTGKPLKGFIYVNSNRPRRKTELRKWVGLSIDYVRTLPKSKKQKLKVNFEADQRPLQKVASQA
jgi:hypothetical protein